ncbi:hypothetical protein VTI74DRAFT_8254 [Chaetomium olivicolor]
MHMTTDEVEIFRLHHGEQMNRKVSRYKWNSLLFHTQPREFPVIPTSDFIFPQGLSSVRIPNLGLYPPLVPTSPEATDFPSALAHEIQNSSPPTTDQRSDKRILNAVSSSRSGKPASSLFPKTTQANYAAPCSPKPKARLPDSLNPSTAQFSCSRESEAESRAIGISRGRFPIAALLLRAYSWKAGRRGSTGAVLRGCTAPKGPWLEGLPERFPRRGSMWLHRRFFVAALRLGVQCGKAVLQSFSWTVLCGWAALEGSGPKGCPHRFPRTTTSPSRPLSPRIST